MFLMYAEVALGIVLAKELQFLSNCFSYFEVMLSPV